MTSRHRNRCFLVALCRLIVKRSNLKAASLSVGKNSGLVLLPWECVLTAVFGSVDLLRQMSSQLESQNHYKHRCIMNSQSTSFIFISFLTQ